MTLATILVVDDNEFVRRTLHSLLSQQPNWTIYEAENGKIALDRVREVHPDVVVLDIVMPEMNGMEAAYKIRQLVPTPKIILISSHYNPGVAAMLARLYGDGNFIAKSEAKSITLHRPASGLRERPALFPGQALFFAIWPVHVS